MDTKNAALENVSRFKCAYFEYLFVKFPWRSQIMGEKNVSKKIFPTMAVEFIAAKKKQRFLKDHKSWQVQDAVRGT